MIAWVHRNLPIVLAAVLSLLLHTAVLFPLIEIVGLGRFADDAEQTSLGKASPGLKGPTLDSERDPRREQLTERERRLQRNLAVRRVQQELREKRAEQPKPEERTPDDPKPEPPKPEEKIELGIDASDAVTMNWIGYAEYQKHLAALAEVEQAALRLEASSGAGGTASPTLPPAPPAPTVAMSPNPGDATLPPTAGGADGAAETNLIAPASTTPSSPSTATARTESPEATGTDAETARPERAPLPAPNGTTAAPKPNATAPNTQPDPVTKPPSDAPTDLPSDVPVDDPTLPPAADTPPEVTPDAAKPKPAPTEIDPAKEPKAETTPTPDATAPNEKPDPSLIEPEKRLDTAKSGEAANLPPRENANPDELLPLPPLPAPVLPKDPSTETSTSETPTPGAASELPTATDATNKQGGGVKGPEVVDGAASTPAPPSPAGTPGDARADQGALSTRESDPTSIIDVPASAWQNGKPLARKGIMLQTVKPRFLTLNLIDGVRFNPIVELIIGRDGVPQHVVIARSSGNAAVNEAIRSALFKWRASGKQITDLKPGQTVTIRLKLIMLQD